MVALSPPPVVRWLAPPRLTTPESTRRAHRLWMVSWSFFGVLAIFLLAASAITPSLLPRRLTSIAAVGTLVGVLHLLNRRDRTALASWLLVLGLTAIVTQRAWHTGGVHAPVALFYMMFILIAGVLLGVYGTVVTAVACVISAAVLAVGEVAGLLKAPMLQLPPPAEPFVASVLAVVVTVLALALFVRHSEHPPTEDLVGMFVRDVRSPLTVMMARLSILQSALDADSEVARDAGAAMAATLRVSQMASNLHDVSRLTATGLPLQRTPVDVSRLASDITHAVRALEPALHIRIDAAKTVICHCDLGLVRRVIENLLDHAVRRTNYGGHIVVVISHARHGVRLSVEDDGPTIPPEELALVFERRSVNEKEQPDGFQPTSLGLAFCKLAVTAHGGSILAESAGTRGSRFIVELPAS